MANTDYNPYTSDLYHAINKSRISMVCLEDAIEREDSMDIARRQAQCHDAHGELLSTVSVKLSAMMHMENYSLPLVPTSVTITVSMPAYSLHL